MDLNITGSVADILPEQSGEGKNGQWRKQEFILETDGDYPKKVCIIQWGDNVEKFGLTKGERITAHVDVQSREFNGKWYTDVKAWKVVRGESQDGPPSQSGEPFPEPPLEEPDDSLPF
jgi:hypothetical protein